MKRAQRRALSLGTTRTESARRQELWLANLPSSPRSSSGSLWGFDPPEIECHRKSVKVFGRHVNEMGRRMRNGHTGVGIAPIVSCFLGEGEKILLNYGDNGEENVVQGAWRNKVEPDQPHKDSKSR